MPTRRSTLSSRAEANFSWRNSLPYLPGLDGLRAIAVGLVLLYHSNLGVMPGGYLGVQVFFVISGYLITLLLLQEWRNRGAIDLGHFWTRRARRLFPAVLALIAFALGYSVLFLPGEVADMRGQVAASLTYVTNWYLILAHQSYFETVGRPSLLRHLWSLAVEEQFYLVFPPLLLVLLRWLKPRYVFFMLIAGAVASAVAMAALFQPDVDPSRLYYGSDTRASALLLGAALAFVWTPWQTGARSIGKKWLDAFGLAAMGSILLACIYLDEFEPFVYQGGLALVALATAIVIAAAATSGTRLSRLLGTEPLTWIGTRSYGIYLWHWVIFDLTRPNLDVPFDGPFLFGLQIAASLAIAEVSYRWIETPIRSGALGRAWQALVKARGPAKISLGLRWASAVTVVLALSITLGTSLVRAQAPAPPEYLALESQSKDLALQSRGEVLTSGSQSENLASVPVGTPAPPATATAIAPSVTSTATMPPPTKSAVALAQTASGAAQGARVTAIGDSVMLGAATELERSIASVQVDAAEGRQVSQAIPILQALRSAGQLGQVVVIHLGNNGTFSARQFDTLMGILGNATRIVVVNDKVPRAWQEVNNRVLTGEAKRYPNVVLVDWNALSAEHPEYFWNDGIHLRPEGAQAYAELIASSTAIP